MRTIPTLSLLIAGCLTTASAHAFERVKLTDGELTCEQLYAEVDHLKALAGEAHDSADTADTIATTTDIAHEGAGWAAQAAVLGGAGSAIPGIAQASSFANLFGGAAKTYSQVQGKSAAASAADYDARKTHLTDLFIKNECKVSALDQGKVSEAKQQLATNVDTETPEEAPKKAGFSLW